MLLVDFPSMYACQSIVKSLEALSNISNLHFTAFQEWVDSLTVKNRFKEKDPKFLGPLLILKNK